MALNVWVKVVSLALWSRGHSNRCGHGTTCRGTDWLSLCSHCNAATALSLLDVLEEEMRHPLIVGVDEWDMERPVAPVFATGCEY